MNIRPNAKSAADIRCKRDSLGHHSPHSKVGDFEMDPAVLQAEVKRLGSKIAELSAQAKNEEKAVREMDSLNSEVQRLTDRLRQSQTEKNFAEQRAAQQDRAAKEAMSQRDAAFKAHSAANLEAERSRELASKLMVQVKELQHQLSEDWLNRTVMQREIDTYAEERKQLSNVQEMLDEETRSRQKLEYQFVEQQNLNAALREEFHARILGDKDRIATLGDCSRLLNGPKQLTDDESVDAFGEVLKRLMLNKSSAIEAHKVKRQLLFCFHPDKNPCVDVATRITQILNSVVLGTGGTRAGSKPPPSTRTSPMRPRPRSSAPGCYVPSDRPQSARPRCRC